MTRKHLTLALRLVLSAIFLYSAWSKLKQSYLVFAMSIDAYQLLPEWAVLTVARTLPWFELAVGIFLLTGLWLRYASIASTALLLFFFSILLYSYGRGMTIDCGCFGVGEALSPKTLLRDGLFVAGSVLLMLLSFRSAPQLPVTAPSTLR